MSRPSSTVCLKGPISTSRISSDGLTRTRVSRYSLGSREGSRSLTSSGRLWAAELSASSATRRTPRSGSPRASRNGDSRAPSTWEPSAQRDAGHHAVGALKDRSASAHLAAATTVALASGEGEARQASRRGSSSCGRERDRRPRHSATTLRAPSSGHSQCCT
ncbi:unnamed protein product, partial [Ixodes hexagonus]